MLSSCAEACSAQSLDFSTILQEPFVEGHLPVYWAILKRAHTVRTNSTTLSDPDTLVLAVLDASLPLNARSIADACLACMVVSDNMLFVRLGKRYPGFSQRIGMDKVLLGGADDLVAVGEQRNGGGAFTVHFSLTQFQLRMRVSKLAKIEFIACGTSSLGKFLFPPCRSNVVLKKFASYV